MYIGMIEVLQKPQWSVQEIRDVVYNSCAKYRDAERGDAEIRNMVKRIAQTEMNRILFYAKEQEAIESGATDSYFIWAGPIDRRMTPMCRFLQTGELKGENNRGEPYDYEELRSELPEWREEGWTLPELKVICRQVHDVFYAHDVVKTPMLSDWQMHINCRHTFGYSMKAPKLDAPIEVDGWIQVDNAQESPASDEKPPEYVGIPPSLQTPSEPKEYAWDGPLQIEFVGDAVMQADDTDDIDIFETPLAQYTFGIEHPMRNVPLFILPESTENDESAIFQFSTVNEFQLGSWLRFVIEELDAGLDMPVIVDVLNSESGMTYQEIGYIQRHWDWLFDVALDMGWIL